MREADNSQRDRHVIGIERHVFDERAVDLQRAHRKALEISERRVPGAEVVDGNAYPRVAQCLELRCHDRGVLDEHRLGQLENQRVG